MERLTWVEAQMQSMQHRARWGAPVPRAEAIERLKRAQRLDDAKQGKG